MADDAFNAGPIEIPVKLKLDEAKDELSALVERFKKDLADAAKSAFKEAHEQGPQARPQPKEPERPVVVQTPGREPFSRVSERDAQEKIDRAELLTILGDIKETLDAILAAQQE